MKKHFNVGMKPEYRLLMTHLKLAHARVNKAFTANGGASDVTTTECPYSRLTSEIYNASTRKHIKPKVNWVDIISSL